VQIPLILPLFVILWYHLPFLICVQHFTTNLWLWAKFYNHFIIAGTPAPHVKPMWMQVKVGNLPDVIVFFSLVIPDPFPTYPHHNPLPTNPWVSRTTSLGLLDLLTDVVTFKYVIIFSSMRNGESWSWYMSWFG
jgi:hypothetical protein